MKTSIINNKSLLKELSLNSNNLADILLKLNLTQTSGNYRTLKKYLKLFNIEFQNKSSKTRLHRRYTFEECFKVNSTIARQHVKKRILKDNLIPYKCIECNINNEWNNKELVLQLEHINGINNDNRIENLCFLCPNCHSQTSTYSARNKKAY